MPVATPEPIRPARARAQLFGAVLFFLVIAGLLVAPIWVVDYPPLLDYPNHLAGSFVLAHLNDPTYRFGQYYGAEWGFYPYLAMDVILLGLHPFLPPLVAGRVFLSLLVLGMPLACWFFLRQANPGEDHLALWGLLNAYHIFFIYGFLNFYLSVVMCLVTLGLWLRYLERPSLLRWCALLLAATGLYFSHILGFGMAALLITAYGFLERRKLRELLLSWLVFMPGAFFYRHSSRLAESQTGAAIFHGFSQKVDSLSFFLRGYSARLDKISLAALALFFLAAWWWNFAFRWNARWLVLAAGFFVLFWALPWSYGEGSELDTRVLPVLFVLVLAVARMGPRGRKLVPLALLVFLLRTANVTENFLARQPELRGLAGSFSRTSPHARVLPIVQANGEENPRDHPFAHFWAYGVIERGWFSPYLFDTKGLLPLRIRTDSYTLDGFLDLDYSKETPDWKQVEEDYDYVWDYNTPRFAASLAGVGKLVYRYGNLEVYQMYRPREGPSGRESPAE
ncbi:MAG TPA: hypothetical protein VKE24_16050 [Candidatus Acidoferrales bacterium]|nr:hypothetical protein [Candidatus Acidoferrales bacterium]